MKTYITKSSKSAAIQKMINEALDILESVGIPVDMKTERARERMAVCFLAVANVTDDWSNASDSMCLKTREIIAIVNQKFGENISSGSYDDIRRKDLKLLTVANVIVNSGDDLSLATNAPTRGYSLHSEFRNLIVH
jgi:type II restriction enzyme